MFTEPMKHCSSSLSLLALLALAGCNSLDRSSFDVGTHLRYPGFETFPTPRSFDGPGHVFRVDGAGKKFTVTQLGVRVDPVGEEEFPEYHQKSDWGANAVAKFMSVALSAGMSSDYTLEVSLGPGSRERTYDLDIDEQLLAAQLDFKPGNRYYVVRETIAVPWVKMTLLDTNEANARLRNAIDKKIIDDATLGWSWTSNDKVSLVRSFRTPHRLFFLADELTPSNVAEKQVRRQTPPMGSVAWASESNWTEDWESAVDGLELNFENPGGAEFEVTGRFLRFNSAILDMESFMAETATMDIDEWDLDAVSFALGLRSERLVHFDVPDLAPGQYLFDVVLRYGGSAPVILGFAMAGQKITEMAMGTPWDGVTATRQFKYRLSVSVSPEGSVTITPERRKEIEGG